MARQAMKVPCRNHPCDKSSIVTACIKEAMAAGSGVSVTLFVLAALVIVTYNEARRPISISYDISAMMQLP